MGREEEEGMEVGDNGHALGLVPEGSVPVPYPLGLLQLGAGTEPEDMPGSHSIHSLIHSFNRRFLCPYDG